MTPGQVFFDVTSTCRSPMNTGIQRIARGLFAAVSRRAPALPVRWHKTTRRYVLLDRAGDRCFRDPFTPAEAGTSFADRAEARPGPLRKLAQSVARFFDKPVPEREAFGPGSAWIAPEIFEDNRMRFWQARPRNAPRRIAVFYDAIPVTNPAWAGKTHRRRFGNYMDALAAFDCVVPISRASAEELLRRWQARGIEPAPLRVEPLPCDFAAGVREAAPAFEARRVLYVSTLEPRKNHTALLEACDLLWTEGLDFTLELVGRASRKIGDQALARVQAAQSGGRNVVWKRHVPDDELRASYRSCSFTVYPSLKEGFGLPILESLWHGKPCVCGANGALGETAAGGGCVTVDQTDPAAIAAAMRALLSDRALYLGKHAEAMRRSFRGWDDYAAAVLRILAGDG